MSGNRIFVAATSQHVGKTTSTLGLMAALRSAGINVGYCKPVGQEFIHVGTSRVDKDAFLFASSNNFELVPELHSPVILGSGATTAFLDNPGQFQFGNKILKASKILDSQYDAVVYEGTGHPGVGSVVGLSNARVAEMLGAGLIMVVEAGIGNTIDLLDLNLSVFEAKNIPILGVIINKAVPDKIEKVRHYVGRVMEARGVKLLGIMPYEDELGHPLMHGIVAAIKAKVEFNEDMLDNRVANLLSGSIMGLTLGGEEKDQLLIVSLNRLSEALRKIEDLRNPQLPYPISGIIIAGKGEYTEQQIELIQQHRIPVARTTMDTYEVVIRISKMEVKINVRTPWKVSKAIHLFRQHVDLAPVLSFLDR